MDSGFAGRESFADFLTVLNRNKLPRGELNPYGSMSYQRSPETVCLIVKMPEVRMPGSVGHDGRSVFDVIAGYLSIAGSEQLFSLFV